MEKVNMVSRDVTADNIEKIGALFPNCITEVKNGDKVEKAIDFDKLRQELSRNLIEGKKERYEFTWPDKRQAIVTANAPISKTLRPVREKSVDFDNTQNVYIEGDNLDALKLLQETYLGKIKMIYIDPPYNTGNDFVYEDDFSQNADDYLQLTGDADAQGNKLTANKDSNGRFHTDWLNMMYPRLKLAKDLLTDDGFIFISIGQEEITNLDKITSDIFGDSNKIGQVCRVTKTASNNGTFFAPTIDYVLCYAKCINEVHQFSDKVDETLYRKTETEGSRAGEKYRDDVALYQASLNDLRPNQKYFITCPDGSLVIPPCSKLDEIMRNGDGRWRWTKEKYLNSKDLLVFKETKNSPLLDQNGKQAKYNVYTKSYLTDRQSSGTLPRELWEDFINRKGADYLKKLDIPFDFSKPYELIKYMMTITFVDKNDVVMDFFAGSSTTAESVMRQNAEDGGNRKFIMVQLPEICDEKSEAKKAGYNTICDIGEERIRRAGKKIKEEAGLMADNLDTGFRVFKIDDSNMKDVYYRPDEFQQDLLLSVEDNINEDRTPEDLLFQVMIDDFGIPLSAKIEKLNVNGKTVFNVEDGHLVACFDKGVTDEVITAMAKLEPNYAVLRDSSYDSDSVAVNFEQIFKKFSPDTVTKIL